MRQTIQHSSSFIDYDLSQSVYTLYLHNAFWQGSPDGLQPGLMSELYMIALLAAFVVMWV